MTATAYAPTFGDVDVTGDGAQSVIGTTVNGDLVQSQVNYVRGRPAFYLSATDITDRVASYVPAGNHDLIVKTLEASHAVCLTGPLGCGRETTAIAALRELRSDIRIRRFSTDIEDTEEIGANGTCGYVVRAADEEPARLSRLVDAVRAAGAYLVVGGDEAEQARLGTILRCVAVEPPHPVQVYRHRLMRRGLADTMWPHWNEASALLENALPAGARRLVDLIEQAERRGGGIAARQADVAHRFRGWAEELRAWFKEHREPRDRALLVAAVTLAPIEETHVYPAAWSLAQRLEIAKDGAGLVWCPVTDLCGLLEAEREDDRIAFRRDGYAESALRHVWNDYPLARTDLLSWLAVLPTDKAVPTRLRNRLVETFADLAAEHGAADRIAEAAQTWAETGLADLAFIALSRTCLHARVGGRVRRTLYEWSYAARTHQTLKLTIARVCEPLGLTYPSIALTRLKHLATNGDGQVVREVITAALNLASYQRRQVLAAALDWSSDKGGSNLSDKARERRIRAGVTIFLHMAGRVSPSGLPEMLDGAEAIDPLRCATAWRSALHTRGGSLGERDPGFEDTVHRWLDAAVRRPMLRERLVCAFVAAAIPHPMPSVYGPGLAETDPAASKIMIDMVRSWAALDSTDAVRREIKEDIVIPLTRPWWLRLLKVLYVWLRTLVMARRSG